MRQTVYLYSNNSAWAQMLPPKY